MMNGGYNVDLKTKCFDTSSLISEIRHLAKSVESCYLPSIQRNYLVDDVQSYRAGKIFSRFEQLNESRTCTNFWDKGVAQQCLPEFLSWRESAVKMVQEDSGLFDSLYNKHQTTSKRRQKRPSVLSGPVVGVCASVPGGSSAVREVEGRPCLDPCNAEEVEEEIRRQRDKFYEEKGGCEVKERQSQKKHRKAWKAMIKKELGRAARQRAAVRKEKVTLLRRAAKECGKLCRQRAVASQKCAKDGLNRGRRLAREISMCWRQLEKEEKGSRRKADRLLSEQKRKSLEVLEARKQQRKLNYLITQTELYTHFMSRKMAVSDGDRGGGCPQADDRAWEILDRIEDEEEAPEDKDKATERERALAAVKEAVDLQLQQAQNFGPVKEAPSSSNESSPSLFRGELKSYQKRGIEWLLYLFEQGINGILADEMGLGKTIQTIAFFATLAEKYELWGPFLIVAPASTVHNWTQEFRRFLPAFRVVPYWGNVGERKILRRFWGGGGGSVLHADSGFHVVVSSYQVVLQDAKMVGRVRWQYLVLDEAHAIKNTNSQRWNTLLSFECRNRLLLTGTPIQNTMQELWALLHFIMPTLFDSHEEFNDWFSRDIESQASAAVVQGAAKQGPGLTTTRLNATQLSRLHLILQPFMLRRVKAEVEHELPAKIEISLQCRLSSRQQALYQRLRRRVRVDDLGVDSRHQRNLLNLVMQLRKVCNHPDLLEPRPERFAVSTRLLSRYVPWPRLLLGLAEARVRPDDHQGQMRGLLAIVGVLYQVWPVCTEPPPPYLLPRLVERAVVVRAVACPVQLAVSAPPATTALPRAPPDILQPPVTLALVESATRISDSTKLAALDKLLARLRRGGHRVLIYSQMTRMIDIIEDLMRLRAHPFIRLDGSSRLSDRRDMVADFQADGDLFAFLLSTRAGGLGINLTAADTVVFFDSDWNPTVDQQAMDRAHRLGQARQVTVYRLVCRDTVEEKILFRAEEKREMHRMVIAGADLCPDNGAAGGVGNGVGQMRPRDVASLLLEDDEMNIRLEQRRRLARLSDQQQRNLTLDQGGDQERPGGLVTFSGESALQKKRRLAWAGVMRGGGRPKKLKLLEPTINNGGAAVAANQAGTTPKKADPADRRKGQ